MTSEEVEVESRAKETRAKLELALLEAQLEMLESMYEKLLDKALK